MFIKSIFAYVGDHLWVFASVIFVFAGGFAAGYLHEHDKLITYKASVDAMAADQERQTQAIIDRHEKTKESIHAEYQDRLARMRADYERRMRNQSTGDLPTACRPACRANDSATDRISFDRQALIERCSETTLQLQELQKWVRER